MVIIFLFVPDGNFNHSNCVVLAHLEWKGILLGGPTAIGSEHIVCLFGFASYKLAAVAVIACKE